MVIYIQQVEVEYVPNHVRILTLENQKAIYVKQTVNGLNLDTQLVQDLVFIHVLKDGLVDQDFADRHVPLEHMEINKQTFVLLLNKNVQMILMPTTIKLFV